MSLDGQIGPIFVSVALLSEMSVAFLCEHAYSRSLGHRLMEEYSKSAAEATFFFASFTHSPLVCLPAVGRSRGRRSPPASRHRSTSKVTNKEKG